MIDMTLDRIDSTEATAKASTYDMIRLAARTMTPLHQGAFDDTFSFQRTPTHAGKRTKNFSAIRTVEWWTKNGWIEVPAISGNSVRGRLRRYAAMDLFNRLVALVPDSKGAQKVRQLLEINTKLSGNDQELLKLFFTGGTLGVKTKKDDVEAEGSATDDGPKFVWALREPLDRTRLEVLLPMLPVFGYTNGDTKMRPSSLAVTDLVPLLDETSELLGQWDGIRQLIDVTKTSPQWHSLLTRHSVASEGKNAIENWPKLGFVRSDPMASRMAEDPTATAADDPTGENAQMMVMDEYMPPGLHLYGGIYLHHSASLVERGMLYTAVDALMADGFLGGMRSQGYGRVQWAPYEMPDKAAAQQAWIEHVADHAEDIAKLLPDLYEHRKSSAKAKPKKGSSRKKGDASKNAETSKEASAESEATDYMMLQSNPTN